MPSIATSLADVERRAQRFFAPDRRRTLDFQENFIAEVEKIGRPFIFGGAIRDLAFFGADERPISDFDVVINGNSAKIDKFAQNIGASRNRFGGYQYCSESLRVDFWAFDKTWAKVEKKAPIFKPDHLIRATFFDWDAILFDLHSGKVVAIDRYLDRLYSRVLEVNLAATPSPHGNLVRALRRLVMFDGKPGKKLQRFLANELRIYDWNSIVSAEDKAFHVKHLKQYTSKLDFYRRFLSDRSRSEAGVHDRRQLDLPLIYQQKS